MDFGMLWFDANPKRSLAEKVERAAAYYTAKYYRAPTVCFAHPGTLGKPAPEHVGAVRLRPLTNIIKDHFWLGIEEDLEWPTAS